MAAENIVELECAGIGFLAHTTLNAIEMTVVAPDGSGFRTWIGADAAPTVALKFGAAVVRLVEGVTT
jgi:hypothetical protein